MFFEKEFKQGKFVSSKNEFCYKEVLDDFQNAKKIGIITYNISKKDNDDLIKRLKNANVDTEIQIITNIPSRFETYFNNRVKKNAQSLINIYLDKLNPKDFDENMEAYFNFNNHIKIITTENIVYWGSANYSNESKLNYEAGTITKDKDFIEYLFNEYFDNIKNDSIPYYDDDYNELRLNVLRLLGELTVHFELFKYEFIRYSEVTNRYFFIGEDTNYSEDDFNELVYILDKWREIRGLIENIDFEQYDIEQDVDELLSIYDSLNIDNIEDLIDYDRFYDYVCVDFQSIYDDRFNDYASVAYDEYLENYIEKASYEAREEIRDLGEQCESGILNAMNDFENFIKTLTEIAAEIEALSTKVVSKGIDNASN